MTMRYGLCCIGPCGMGLYDSVWGAVLQGRVKSVV